MMKIADCCVQKHHKLIQHPSTSIMPSCHIQWEEGWDPIN